MNEVDDRLVGDPVWELFPYSAQGRGHETQRPRDYFYWLGVVGVVAVGWRQFPPSSVVAVCLGIAYPDFRTGRRVAQSIPHKAGATICARFAYAWGLLKLAMAAFASMFFFLITSGEGPLGEIEVTLKTALLLCLGGFALSAGLTAWGLFAAYRSGMRVWIGKGVNQARTLFLAMLLVGFTFLVLGPLGVLLVGLQPRADHEWNPSILFWLGFFAVGIVGPILVLIILDRVCRQVVADQPGKFDPKVPIVGRWNSDSK